VNVTKYISIFLLVVLVGCESLNTIASQIQRVENGLLPPVLIKGEPAWTLQERMEHYKVPGISIAVIKDFRIDWVKHYGVIDNKTQEPVTDNTLFGVGSCSKTVTAMAVLKKAEEGRIILDGNINDQLVSWKLPVNEFTQRTAATPRLLLNHTAGVISTPGYGYEADNAPTLIQILNGEKPAQNQPAQVNVDPGTIFRYSNLGISILQQLLIDVENKPFPEIMKQIVFDSLGMSQSTFKQPLPAQWEQYAATGHRSDGTPNSGKRLIYPDMAAASLWTTVEDFARFVIELQLSFHGRSNKVLSAEMVDTMLTPFVAEKYGLGTGVWTEGAETYFSHFGDIRGFFSGYVAHKTKGYGAVILSNSSNGLNLEREILKSIAKVYEWKGYLPKEFEIVDIDSELLKTYSGRYLIGSDNVLTLSMEDSRLYMQTTEIEKTELFPISHNKFVAKERKGDLTFLKDSSGVVIEAVHHFADQLGRLSESANISKRLQDDYKIPFELLEEGRLEEAIDGYRRIKQNNPNDFYVSEQRLNGLGYELLFRQKYTEAIGIFRVNIALYPNSANCYDSMGEAYLKSGNRELAIKNYRKSLELNPYNSNAVEVLTELGAK